MRSVTWVRCVALGMVLATATMASAQTITGTVRDESGAVLPGVTVEASSPALIEKVRSGITDGTGQYRIQAVGVMVPGVTAGAILGQSGRDVGGNTKLQQPAMNFRGQSQTVQRWDSFRLTNLGAGAATSFYVNDGATRS